MNHDFGQRLAAAREARGLSIEDAAKTTRIASAYIRALEDGNLTRFPNAAYAKSFLRMYARHLDVNVDDVDIDTTPQVKVADFQYLTNLAAEDKKLRKAAVDTREDFPAQHRDSRSWKPLFIAGGVTAVAAIAFIIWMNIHRIGAFVEQPAEPRPPAAAAIAPAAESPAAPEPIAPRAVVVAPKPVVVAPAPAEPAPAPVEPEIPRARPISPIATAAAGDAAALAEITPQKPIPAPAAAVVENDDTITLAPKRTTWVVIRTGPGGQPVFEDFLYASARPMRLPAGSYFIEIKEADSVTITKGGRRIAYTAPGVVVQ